MLIGTQIRYAEADLSNYHVFAKLHSVFHAKWIGQDTDNLLIYVFCAEFKSNLSKLRFSYVILLSMSGSE